MTRQSYAPGPQHTCLNFSLSSILLRGIHATVREGREEDSERVTNERYSNTASVAAGGRLVKWRRGRKQDDAQKTPDSHPREQV